jgi:hypothetical protein
MFSKDRLFGISVGTIVSGAVDLVFKHWILGIVFVAIGLVSGWNAYIKKA